MANRKISGKQAAKQKAERKRKRLGLLLLLLAIPIVAGLIFMSMPRGGSQASSGPQFTKEGELSFVGAGTGETIKSIDIEVKQDSYERAEGMMWRKSMEDTQGMLFIMDAEEPQTFWMRNTYIPLDIIFVSADKTILNVRANAPPETLGPQSSKGNALYVVEVNGGFCAKYGIEAGDKITFELGQF